MRDTMGIIFTESDDVSLKELTETRSVAALPVAGRYRLIDFMLSCMANSGMINVGIATKSKYSSLMDHLGAGAPWDLQREQEGLYIMPPFVGNAGYSATAGDIDSLMGMMPYLRRSRQKYVLLADGNTVCNMTFRDMLAQHKQTGADITICCRAETGDSDMLSHCTVAEVAADGRIVGLEHCPKHPKSRAVSMHICLMEKELLIRLAESCASRGEHSFVMNALIYNVHSLKLYAYMHSGFCARVDTVKSYFATNMQMLQEDVRAALFGQQNAIFTKVKASVPTKYGDHARVADCLVADGCVIDGSVENSVIFRGVRIGKNTVVKNAVVMEKTYIDADCETENIIFDKECLVRAGKRLIGQPNYPVIVRKRTII